MILNIALKLIQSHGYISIKAQLNLSNRIEIGETQPKKKKRKKKRLLKSRNFLILGLKSLSKF